jgi:uncharacterized membrane protein
MSIQSMANLAEERDSGTPRRPAARRSAARAAQPAPTDQQTRTDVLISAIPTEVLGPYTAIVGVVVSTIDSGEGDRAFLRWTLYGVGLLAIVFWLGSAYLRGTARKRRFPLAETLAALFAFAGWGLVMPGSPLSLSLSGDDLTIWTAIITAAAVFLVGVLAGTPLKKAVAK